VGERALPLRGCIATRAAAPCGAPIRLTRAVARVPRAPATQLLLGALATMLLPVLQLLAARRAESARDAGGGGRGGAFGAFGALPALPAYMRVVPRRRGEPEPGCEGWRADADAAGGGAAQAVAPLERAHCFVPLNHTAGGSGAARRGSARAARRGAAAAEGPTPFQPARDSGREGVR
jgi:hypothetical protein